VAPQGTAFTGDHARILKRYVNEVVLCFDSDQAGKNAAIRGLDGILNSAVFQRPWAAYEGGKVVVRVASIPTPHDPDSYIKEYGPEAFRELIAKAEGIFDFYLRLLCETNDVTS